MSTLTKLLPANAAPAQTLLDKAHALPLTSAQRAELPQVIHTPEGEVELGVPADQLRPVEVNDVFVDEKGGFWAVRPAVEKVLNVTGDVNVLREAAGALVNRGVRIAQIEEGFAVLPLPNLAKMLQMVGLEVTEAESPFDPIQFKAAHGGCGCHDDEDSCGCGHHHHHHDHDADEVFTSWGLETNRTITKEKLESLLQELAHSEKYGQVLRAKGMLPDADGTWYYFDLVPEETEIRTGAPIYTGKVCVIGSNLKEDELKAAFEA